MPPAKTLTIKPISRIKLGDNREVRIVRIPTGTDEDLIRVGVNLANGDDLSGAVFPESHLDEVIEALRAAKRPVITRRLKKSG